LVESIPGQLSGMLYVRSPQLQLEIYTKYSRDDVIVLGLATAFEDYDKNTLDNLRLLLTSGEVNWRHSECLETVWTIDRKNNILPYKIPFP